MSMTA